MTDDERGRLTRRSLITKGAAAGGVLWAAPVIESFVSKAAAASNGFSCLCANIFYKHNNGQIFVISFVKGATGATGTPGCTSGVSSCCDGTVTCNGVIYTVSGTTATAGGTAVGGFSGNGDCQGQFSITANLISGGGSSNTILAGIAKTSAGTCVTACPTGTTTGNSITFPGC
jgi:hypothetical protein